MNEYTIESGIVAYQQGDKAQAAIIFTYLIKQDPNFADAWFWLGRCIDDRSVDGNRPFSSVMDYSGPGPSYL